MSTVTAVKNELQKTQTKDLKTLIEESAKELKRALPEHLRPERLVRIALTCIRQNPELAKTTPESFLGALFTAAAIGLEPIAGRSYLIPFKNKRKIGDEWTTIYETQFLIGFKGLIELFYRHSSSLSIDMQVVCEKDFFEYQYGTESFLRHQPAKKDRGSVIGYYSIAKLKGGGSIFFYISKEDALEHGRRHSKVWDKDKKEFYSSSPWAKEPDAMGQKTCLIQLAKRLPLSVELQRAIDADSTSRDFHKGIGDVLDIPSTTDWSEEEKDTKALPAPSDTIDIQVESVSLTEWKQKEAWTIRTPDGKKFWTSSKEIADAALEYAKSGEVLKTIQEKKEPGVWIVEAIKQDRS